MNRAAMLLTMMDEAFERLRSRLDGLSDEEFFWQPVPNSWTIYLDHQTSRWTYHYAIPDPVPAPVTTIGWQLVHVALCKVMYHEWAFGAAKLTWPELDVPHTAADTIALLRHGQSLLRQDLENLSEQQLDQQRKTNWGELWPAWRIFWAMLNHDAQHGGAIGHLRDLYRWTPALDSEALSRGSRPA
jgi:hypothetical protein